MFDRLAGNERVKDVLRRMLAAVGNTEGTELVLNRLAKTESNKEFLASLHKSGVD